MCFTEWDWGAEIQTDVKRVQDFPGSAAGSVLSAMDYADNVVFHSPRGHGLAAEKANHLYDVFTGKDAKLVGGDNAKNGADRLVNGTQIQSKYCRTGSKCVSDAFEGGSYRYWDSNGQPMALEVPSDKYDDAVKAMADRIRKGQVKGVTDPEKAKEIIRKGTFTYEQARNVARFGTIESITYDAVNGVKIAGTALGISASISFALSVWNGDDFDVALKAACYDGLKVGGIAWVSGILTAQLGRTGVEQGLRGATDWVVRKMGYKACASVAVALRSGSPIYGAAAANYVSKLLRGNVVTGVVTTTVISSVDIVRMCRGQVSGAQAFKNVTTTAAGVAGGTGGWIGGAAFGATVGSAVPVLGTAAGAVIGGVVGSLGVGTGASYASSALLGQFIEDDAQEMLVIVQNVFDRLAFDYMLSEDEAEQLLNQLRNTGLADNLRKMYASKDRELFVKNLLMPIVIDVTANRKKIVLPSELQIIDETRRILEKRAVTEVYG